MKGEKGAPGTTINGSQSPFVTNRAVTNIVANLNGGNDGIGFGNNAQGLANQADYWGGLLPIPVNDLQNLINTATGNVPTFTLPGSLSVTTGAGDDGVAILGSIGGSVAANLGSALTGTDGNRLVIGDTNAKNVSSSVGGAVSVVGGEQGDQVAIFATNVRGGVSLALGNGDNYAELQGPGATIGSFAYTGGTGNDQAMLANQLTVRNDVNVFTGPRGQDGFGMSSQARVNGSVVVNTGTAADGDFIFISQSTIRRDLSLTTGAGDDGIGVFDSTIGGAAAVASNAGIDTILVGGSTVGLSTVIDAGAGNDSVSVVSFSTRSNLVVTLGAGNNVLTLNNARAFAAFLYGGTGTNTLNTDAATRTGVRALKYFRFQTVNDSPAPGSCGSGVWRAVPGHLGTGRRGGRRTLDERVAAAATARICKTAQRRLLPPPKPVLHQSQMRSSAGSPV